MLVRSIAPLRLGLAGGGTDVSPYSDVHGGYVLNVTINLFAHCSIARRGDDIVEFNAFDLGEKQSLRAATRLELDGKMSLHKAVYNRFVHDYNNDTPLSIEVSTYCDAPPGSGLGSSSTLVVAMVTAFAEYLGVGLGEYDIAQLAYEIERKDVQLAGGKQDQYSAAFGGFNFMEFYDNDRVIVNPLRIKQTTALELNENLLLYYTGRSRESANIIREQASSLIRKDERSVAAMHQAKSEAVKMKEYILQAKFGEFAKLLGEAWNTKKQMAVSISNSMIDEIYKSAVDAGAQSGKISGAGGGGFMLFYVDPYHRSSLVDALGKFSGQIIDFRFYFEGALSWKVH